MPEFEPTALLTELLCLLLSYVLHVSKQEAAYGSFVMFHLHCVHSRAVNTVRKTREEGAIVFIAETNLRNRATY